MIMMVVVRAEMVKVEGEEEENEEDGGDKSEGEVEHFSKEGPFEELFPVLSMFDVRDL